MKYRIRFGLKTGWPFPNKGVVIFYVDGERRLAIANAVQVLKMALNAAGQVAIVDRLVFEEELVK